MYEVNDKGSDGLEVLMELPNIIWYSKVFVDSFKKTSSSSLTYFKIHNSILKALTFKNCMLDNPTTDNGCYNSSRHKSMIQYKIWSTSSCHFVQHNIGEGDVHKWRHIWGGLIFTNNTQTFGLFLVFFSVCSFFLNLFLVHFGHFGGVVKSSDHDVICVRLLRWTTQENEPTNSIFRRYSQITQAL